MGELLIACIFAVIWLVGNALPPELQPTYAVLLSFGLLVLVLIMAGVASSEF